QENADTLIVAFLDLKPGDQVQMKKGGNILMVMDNGGGGVAHDAEGVILAKTASGKEKKLYALDIPAYVTKADGSKLGPAPATGRGSPTVKTGPLMKDNVEVGDVFQLTGPAGGYSAEITEVTDLGINYKALSTGGTGELTWGSMKGGNFIFVPPKAP